MRRLLLHSVNIISMRPIKSNDIFFYGYGYIKTPSKNNIIKKENITIKKEKKLNRKLKFGYY